MSRPELRTHRCTATQAWFHDEVGGGPCAHPGAPFRLRFVSVRTTASNGPTSGRFKSRPSSSANALERPASRIAAECRSTSLERRQT